MIKKACNDCGKVIVNDKGIRINSGFLVCAYGKYVLRCKKCYKMAISNRKKYALLSMR